MSSGCCRKREASSCYRACIDLCPGDQVPSGAVSEILEACCNLIFLTNVCPLSHRVIQQRTMFPNSPRLTAHAGREVQGWWECTASLSPAGDWVNREDTGKAGPATGSTGHCQPIAGRRLGQRRGLWESRAKNTQVAAGADKDTKGRSSQWGRHSYKDSRMPRLSTTLMSSKHARRPQGPAYTGVCEGLATTRAHKR